MRSSLQFSRRLRTLRRTLEIHHCHCKVASPGACCNTTCDKRKVRYLDGGVSLEMYGMHF